MTMTIYYVYRDRKQKEDFYYLGRKQKNSTCTVVEYRKIEIPIKPLYTFLFFALINASNILYCTSSPHF